MQRLPNLELLADATAPVDVRDILGEPRALPVSRDLPSALTDVLVWDLGPGDPVLDPGTLRGVDAPVVVLVAPGTEAAPLLAAGAAAVLSRTVTPTALGSVVETVRHGLTVIDPALRTYSANADVEAHDRIDDQPTTRLTPREREVLELLARGLSNRAIGKALSVSDHTAKFHVASILEKFDADTRTEAVVTALRAGVLEL